MKLNVFGTLNTENQHDSLCYESQRRHVAISEVSAWADEATAPVAVVTGSSVRRGDGDTRAAMCTCFIASRDQAVMFSSSNRICVKGHDLGENKTVNY